jgi:hypothetical protein
MAARSFSAAAVMQKGKMDKMSEGNGNNLTFL